MIYPDGTILKGSSRVLYVIEGGYRRSIACCITFDSKGYDWNNIIFISDQDLNAIPLGAPVTSDETAPKWEETDRLIRNRFETLKANDTHPIFESV
ncbi:MAG: hypothetical protein HZA13_09085 [Nitrospirae bacterium]|nr:hypothetical protein [Nitrospirota bacterium]